MNLDPLRDLTVMPAIVIELEVEAAPRVRIRAANEAEEIRVMDWIHHDDKIAVIVLRALDLAEQHPAA